MNKNLIRLVITVFIVAGFVYYFVDKVQNIKYLKEKYVFSPIRDTNFNVIDSLIATPKGQEIFTSVIDKIDEKEVFTNRYFYNYISSINDDSTCYNFRQKLKQYKQKAIEYYEKHYDDMIEDIIKKNKKSDKQKSTFYYYDVLEMYQGKLSRLGKLRADELNKKSKRLKLKYYHIQDAKYIFYLTKKRGDLFGRYEDGERGYFTNLYCYIIDLEHQEIVKTKGWKFAPPSTKHNSLSTSGNVDFADYNKWAWAMLKR